MLHIGSSVQFVLALVLVLLTFVGAGTETMGSLQEGLAKVSSSFYLALSEEDPGSNLVCSPASLAMVMGMIQSGAAGTTAAEIERALRFPNDNVLKALGELQINLTGSDQAKSLPVLLANNIFVQLGFNFKNDFQRGLQDHLNANPEALNFGDSVSAAQSINGWVAQKSQGKIAKLFEEDSFTEDDRAVLVSAIHFKGQWKYEFPKEKTEKSEFYIAPGKDVMVDMMNVRKVSLPFLERTDIGLKVLQLPFKSENLTMVILLPNKIDGITDLEAQLSSRSILSFASSLSTTKLDVYLPKFEMESSFDLKNPLNAMGIHELFDRDRANLNGIFETLVPGLHVSKVVQKAIIEINEEGCEAAAATGAGMRSRRAAEFTQEFEFRADHPFIFAIVHSTSDEISEKDSTVLFMGKYCSPAKSQATGRDEL